MSSKSSRNHSAGLSAGSMILAGALAAALSAQGQTFSVIDDFEAGSNQNKFLGYSYFYNDAADKGTSEVLSSKPGATATELLVDGTKSFDVGNGSSKALKLDFKFGAVKPSCGATCSYGQMVGFGTQLIAGTDAIGATDGKVIDLTGATAISFWAKASVGMTVRVEITTTPVKNFAFHRAEVPITATWTKYTVLLSEGLGGIAQPAWNATSGVAVPFDPTKVQKLQFQVSAENNLTLTAGTLWIDDIHAEGYTWTPPSACMKCVGAGPATGALFSNLEEDATETPARPAHQNAAGGFWFVYNDVGTRTVASQSDYSEIYEGVDITDPKVPVFMISPTKGASNGPGAYIKFNLGKSYTETAGGTPIMPFVGLGTKTSDAVDAASWDATGSTGIAFDYWTEATSTFQFIRLEVKTKQTDLGTNPGVVHQVLLPATAGAWKTAIVPWTSFTLPDWDEIPNKLAPVQTSSIMKFQWAVQDAPGTKGALAIDNVKMPGLTTIKKITIGVRPNARNAARGLDLHQAAGRLDVSFDLPAGVRDAQVSLIDMNGSVVATRSLSGHGRIQAALETRNLRSGVYSLKVRHGDVVRSAAVTLLQ